MIGAIAACVDTQFRLQSDDRISVDPNLEKNLASQTVL